ncbi:hypothetical protein FHR84_000556 [Actinopolyspora biskrensis]|uniref:Uncharacterized protein n=1 Tax=Actinopolyspora biskrensis TaxID=1470178 RepID=A0A852YU31_9ACTN|nr:hypothetical protein [Actinopolyspora biskrensis]NYH77242.1 hypothetical protein [Actinopolyspora biskrensis]
MRKLVLQEYLDVTEPGIGEIGQQRWKAALPGSHLGRSHSGAELEPGLLVEKQV